HVALARQPHPQQDERVRVGGGGARTGQQLGAAAGGSPHRRGKRRSRTTAQRPPMNTMIVHVVFGYPLLWAKSRRMIASQVWSPSTVPTSVGQGSSGATKANPDQYERNVASVMPLFPASDPLYTPPGMRAPGASPF